MRDRLLSQLAVEVTACLLLSPALAHDSGVIDEIELVPPSDQFPESMALIEDYAAQPDWDTAVVVDNQGAPAALQLIVPDPFAGGSSLEELGPAHDPQVLDLSLQVPGNRAANPVPLCRGRLEHRGSAARSEWIFQHSSL